MRASPSPRFAFLDALRGIASFGVLCHHLYFLSVMDKVYEATSPALVTTLFGLGARGVEIFFVLSGFVIAHSLRSNPLTRLSLSRFMLRRQVRLDPPYWAALLLALILGAVEHFMPGLKSAGAFPSTKDVLLNFVYLQHIFHLPRAGVLLDVSWTLCLEIQFYLLFLVVLGVFQKPTTRRFQGESESGETPPIGLATVLAMWVSGGACLAVARQVASPAYFWAAWQYFVLGSLAYWAMMGKIKQGWLWSFLLLFVGSGLLTYLPAPPEKIIHSHQLPALVVGCATGLSLFLLGRAQKLGLWKEASVIQYLGKISYSLYLTHAIVLLIVLRLAYKITGNNVVAAWVWFVVCGALCVAVAHAFYKFVELPSLNWANAMKVGNPFRRTPPQTNDVNSYPVREAS